MSAGRSRQRPRRIPSWWSPHRSTRRLSVGAGCRGSCGLWWHALYRDNTWSKAAFRGGDLVTLAFAVPVLIIATLLARRGNGLARLVWAGVLANSVYNYDFYLFGTVFNKLFLL